MPFALPTALVAGTDLSTAAASALRLAMALARESGAAVDVLHAVDSLPSPALLAPLEVALAEAVQLARSDSVEPAPRSLVVAGPATSLLTEAAQPGAWILVGCEGSSATLQRRTGSVTSALVARGGAPVPVLVAPPSWGVGRGRTRRHLPRLGGRLLAGLSGGPRDGALLDVAASLARRLRGTLALAHVIDLGATRDSPAPLRRQARAESVVAAEAVRERLADLLEDSPAIPPEERHHVLVHVVRQGPVHADLAGLAGSQATDVLVLGSGGVAVRACGLTRCPVLVLP